MYTQLPVYKIAQLTLMQSNAINPNFFRDMLIQLYGHFGGC